MFVCSIFEQAVFSKICDYGEVATSFCPYNSIPYLFREDDGSIRTTTTDERNQKFHEVEMEKAKYDAFYKKNLPIGLGSKEKVALYAEVKKSFPNMKVVDHLFTNSALLEKIFELLNLILPGSTIQYSNGYKIPFLLNVFKPEGGRGIYVLRALRCYNGSDKTVGNVKDFHDHLALKLGTHKHREIILEEAKCLDYDPFRMTFEDWKNVWFEKTGDANRDWYKLSDTDLLDHLGMGNIDLEKNEQLNAPELYDLVKMGSAESGRAFEWLTKLFSSLILPKSTNDIINYIAAAGIDAPSHNRGLNKVGETVSRDVHELQDKKITVYVDAMIAFYTEDGRTMEEKAKRFQPFDHVFHDAERDDHFVCFMNDDLARALNRTTPEKTVVWLNGSEKEIPVVSLLKGHSIITIPAQDRNNGEVLQHFTERDNYTDWFNFHGMTYMERKDAAQYHFSSMSV
jgi:hypothetical protein